MTYYVDSLTGSNSNLGTSPDKAWLNVVAVNAHHYKPGDSILFKRGTAYAGTDLVINANGYQTAPITMGAYGEGDLPALTGPDNALRINGSWIIVENLAVVSSVENGVNIGGDHCIVRNCEITDCGIGVVLRGKHNLITSNSIHDLHMIVNDEGGGGNDYGALGVMFSNGPNEVSYNQFTNCKAMSLDFGYDGGAVDFFLTYGSADGSSIHHNVGRGNEGFIEIHSATTAFSVRNVYIYRNLVIDSRSFMDIGLPGSGRYEPSIVENLLIEFNTIAHVTQGAEADWTGAVFSFHDAMPTAEQIQIRDNIIYSSNAWVIAAADGFAHERNCYQVGDGQQLGLTVGPTEIEADPMFVDADYHIDPNSPAAGMGVYG